MRYLNKREDFLKQKQHIKGVPYETLLEMTSSAGPFANDVGWNDSLLGRLINHAIRKARIAAKVPTIKRLIDRLKIEFDQIVGQSTVFSLDDESQKLKVRVEISKFFEQLIKSVEAGEPVSILKSLTDGCIDKVNSMKDFDKKEILLEELKKFREFLDQFKDEEGSDDEDDNKENEKTEVVGGSDSKIIDLMFKNLEALKNIIYYKDTVKKDVEKPTFKVGDIVTFTNKVKKKNKVKILSLDNKITPGVDNIFLTKDDGPIAPKPQVSVKPNLWVVYVDDSGNPIKNSKNVYSPFPAAPEQLTVESMIFEKENLQYRNPVEKTRTNTIGNKSGANIDRNNIFKGEDPHLTQSLDNLKKSIDGLVGSQNQPAITIDFINNILSDKLNNRKVIKSLYKEINEFMIGKYKLSDLGPLYKEGMGIEYLTKRNQLNMVAKKIALFAKRAIQFNGENMYGGLGDLGKHLKIFVDTIIPLTKTSITERVDILNYFKFLEAQTILSDDRTAEEKVGNTPNTPVQQGTSTTTPSTSSTGASASNTETPDGNDQSKKILEFFNENCKEVRAFTVSDVEIEGLNKKMEESEKNNKGILMSMDPIIEIMKLFIKAYKTYTVLTITKRTERVDTNTLSEYTSFGSSSAEGDTGRSGPYRNNKLFDLWEEAVNDIRKDRKYQAIFTENANLRLPKVTDPDPTSPADWVIKPKAGIAFRKFINDVLDGDTLYKSGSTGAVATFIEKYFGDGSVSENAAKGLQGSDLTAAEEAATTIEKNAIKLKLKEETVVVPKANTFFTIKGMQPSTTDPDTFNKGIQRSFFVDKVDGNFVWLLCTVYLKRFAPLLDKLDKKHTFLDGDFTLAVDNTGGIEFTKISVANFAKLRKGQTIKLTTLDITGKEQQKSIKIDGVYSLIKENDNIVYTLSEEERNKFNTVLKDKRLIDAISKDIVKNKLQTSTNTEITLL